MREFKVRRLPVVDREGKLVGILSTHDIVLAAAEKGGFQSAKYPELNADQILTTFRSISERHHPAAASL